jgi:hypothetical protein
MHKKIRKLRHAVRAIRFPGVMQCDWHLGQVLCIPRELGSAEEFNYDLVLIDFAFALQRLGEQEGTPLCDDVDTARSVFMLGFIEIPNEVKAPRWDEVELVEEEY